jgi:hypothetical protein
MGIEPLPDAESGVAVPHKRRCMSLPRRGPIRPAPFPLKFLFPYCNTAADEAAAAVRFGSDGTTSKASKLNHGSMARSS